MREAMQSAYPDLPKAWIDSIVSQTSEESGATAQSYGAVLKLSQVSGRGRRGVCVWGGGKGWRVLVCDVIKNLHRNSV
jgi:hypothetical protein